MDSNLNQINRGDSEKTTTIEDNFQLPNLKRRNKELEKYNEKLKKEERLIALQEPKNAIEIRA